jgi:hypothetical protein
MFAFSSKYALALYEAVCLRGNLQTSHRSASAGVGRFQKVILRARIRRSVPVKDGDLRTAQERCPSSSATPSLSTKPRHFAAGLGGTTRGQKPGRRWKR